MPRQSGTADPAPLAAIKQINEQLAAQLSETQSQLRRAMFQLGATQQKLREEVEETVSLRAMVDEQSETIRALNQHISDAASTPAPVITEEKEQHDG